jgi:hypothetical protein
MTTMAPVRDYAYRRFVDGRLSGMRVNRYSWWTHWREVADFELPRRYKWLITPNQMARGSPINQHILDSTGTLAARNLASGLVSGKSSPTRPWFKLKIGRLDSTQTSPISLWLAECERLLALIFHESNFYNAIAVYYMDLVVFGTAALLIYEDFENVIKCYNPCLGEYYVDLDGAYRPVIFYREFTMTVSAVVDEFGIENCSDSIRNLYNDGQGANLTREIIVAHAIEPNNDGRARQFGFSPEFKYREAYWEYGGSSAPQGGGTNAQGFLRRRGYYDQCAIICRWDLVSNDPYGRSPGMDALPDIKQLQLETRRKAQAIDKMVNPPMVADVQMKNQPASLLPGGITYVNGFAASGKPAFASAYDTKFPVGEIKEDLDEVKERIRRTFFNDVLQTASQYETRSNVTAIEWDMRKSESLVMLGPALERIDHEALKPIIERVFNIAKRAGILPPPPPEIAGQSMEIEFVSMLQQAQQAAQSAGIERLLSLAGNLVAVKPETMDKIDTDYALDKYSFLLNNDPRLMRSDEQTRAIREDRARQQAQAQAAEQADLMAKAGKTLSETDVGGGINALQLAGGVAP